ncbi:hypothetical protein CLV98_103285 [Dyadobacter jejuensis]|uniref:Uncharacterized protein n=1 Tax=Dyadobacter jejuensis TaxID=1082580 RepID=A0A316B8R1_9BACT|nr:hypothetical protein CLV98_103285 [Dyadobacter jejuensis]
MVCIQKNCLIQLDVSSGSSIFKSPLHHTFMIFNGVPVQSGKMELEELIDKWL